MFVQRESQEGCSIADGVSVLDGPLCSLLRKFGLFHRTKNSFMSRSRWWFAHRYLNSYRSYFLRFLFASHVFLFLPTLTPLVPHTDMSLNRNSISSIKFTLTDLCLLFSITRTLPSRSRGNDLLLSQARCYHLCARSSVSSCMADHFCVLEVYMLPLSSRDYQSAKEWDGTFQAPLFEKRTDHPPMKKWHFILAMHSVVNGICNLHLNFT